MNTSTPLDPRSLAHRLTTVGHTLHHRLVEHLLETDIDPRTVAVLRTVAGELDAPWIADRIARGGKRVRALADRGLLARDGDGWTLTEAGRAEIDRADAGIQALRDRIEAAVPADDLAAFGATLDALSTALGIDAGDERRGARPPFGRRGFGPGPLGGFGPGAPRAHGFGPRARHGFGPHADGAACHGGASERGAEPGRHAAERAYERGFDAGFTRGRDAAASV